MKKTTILGCIFTLIIWWVAWALYKFTTLTKDTTWYWVYKCITNNPTGKSDIDNPKLTIDQNSYEEMSDILWWKDKNGVYYCMWTKKITKADSLTFTHIEPISTTSEPILYKDKQNIYLVTNYANLGSNGISYITIKSYKAMNSSTFSCFYAEDIKTYCKDKKRIYIIMRTMESNSHISRAYNMDIFSTNLDPILISIAKGNIVTYDGKDFDTINNQLKQLLSWNNYYGRDNFIIKEISSPIIFK